MPHRLGLNHKYKTTPLHLPCNDAFRVRVSLVLFGHYLQRKSVGDAEPLPPEIETDCANRLIAACRRFHITIPTSLKRFEGGSTTNGANPIHHRRND